MSHSDPRQCWIQAPVHIRMLASKPLHPRLERVVRKALSKVTGHLFSSLTRFPIVTQGSPARLRGHFLTRCAFSPLAHSPNLVLGCPERQAKTTHHLSTFPLCLPANQLQDSRRPSRWQLRSICVTREDWGWDGQGSPQSSQFCLSPLPSYPPGASKQPLPSLEDGVLVEGSALQLVAVLSPPGGTPQMHALSLACLPGHRLGPQGPATAARGQLGAGWVPLGAGRKP